MQSHLISSNAYEYFVKVEGINQTIILNIVKINHEFLFHFRMTKTLSMISHKNYNLNANEGFVILLTSKLITCFFFCFILKMKSHSIAYFLNGSEHIY